MAKKKETIEDGILDEEEEVLDINENGDDEGPAKKTKVKNKQVRYIFMSEKGWYEKERDNVRITKYYETQQEAIDAARVHIKNSGLPGSIVIQSKKGKIRANFKVAKKK